MKVSHIFVGSLLAYSTAASALFPPRQLDALGVRHPEPLQSSNDLSDAEQLSEFTKRRGGGGRSGGSVSSGSRGGSDEGEGSSSSSSGSRPASSRPDETSSSSNTGGRTSSGSGPRPAYGGGVYYGGGTKVPFRAGGTSPGGINPRLVGVGALGGIGAASIYHVPVYLYAFPHPWYFHNDTSNQNNTVPVDCVCQQYQTCGCDDNNNSTYIKSVVGNGSPAALMANNAYITTSSNGTKTILLNGTLPNGTTAAGVGVTTKRSMLSTSGYAALAVIVAWGCFAL